ncbi:hypothetical protein MINTM008_28030 [Mycobacterium intracellulare]|nr:hypothetical protein MINTM002_24960 [Mycobacterium intracellulare]BCO62643.1 hypothetical protein MINTM006_25930 [Mycobacterium intracellulare]BCO67941.1 hypothetical protein MINTM007_25520 [Mycobacterium intracellulare]BCO73468.1 hypothetical protein MINTM008_28030 [Mycobacterium intracellulare]BCO78910.1 hypothetical protein MINTM009_26920 [Mycobacterium intracellulare]
MTGIAANALAPPLIDIRTLDANRHSIHSPRVGIGPSQPRSLHTANRCHDSSRLRMLLWRSWIPGSLCRDVCRMRATPSDLTTRWSPSPAGVTFRIYSNLPDFYPHLRTISS